MTDNSTNPAGILEKRAQGLCLGAIQSCYVPWRGYFDFIDSVDLFVIYDDVQYSTGTWRNRNQVKTSNGLKWLTVPVSHRLGMSVDEVAIGKSNKPWRKSHRGILREALGPAPYADVALELWEQGVAEAHDRLSPLNVLLIKIMCEFLEIRTPIVNSRDCNLSGSGTDRLMELLRKFDAARYLSGPAAESYLDEDLFRRHNIELAYKTYDYLPYDQPWGRFEGAVTVLDLIANLGPRSRDFVKSRTPDQVVVAKS